MFLSNLYNKDFILVVGANAVLKKQMCILSGWQMKLFSANNAQNYPVINALTIFKGSLLSFFCVSALPWNSHDQLWQAEL